MCLVIEGTCLMCKSEIFLCLIHGPLEGITKVIISNKNDERFFIFSISFACFTICSQMTSFGRYGKLFPKWKYSDIILILVSR